MPSRQEVPRAVLSLGWLGVSLGAAQGRMHKVQLGPVAGITLAQFGGSDTKGRNVDTRTGFLVGGVATIRVHRHVAIEPQAFYLQKGAEYTAGVRARVKLDYVEVPVLLKILFPPRKEPELRPYFAVGPALAFKARCKLNFASGGVSVSEDCKDEDVDAKGTDFSLLFAAGVAVRRLTFGLHYDLGLSTVDGSTNPVDLKNRVAGFSIGYGFRLR